VGGVRRFRREWMDSGTWIARLPQKDFCQAPGYPPGLKYERNDGAGMAKCPQSPDGCEDAQRDRMALQLTQLRAAG